MNYFMTKDAGFPKLFKNERIASAYGASPAIEAGLNPPETAHFSLLETDQWMDEPTREAHVIF